MTKQATT